MIFCDRVLCALQNAEDNVVGVCKFLPKDTCSAISNGRGETIAYKAEQHIFFNFFLMFDSSQVLLVVALASRVFH